MRLLAEVHDAPAESGRRELHTLRSLRELLGAGVAVRCRASGTPDDLRFHGVVGDGLTAAQRQWLEQHAEERTPQDPCIAALDGLTHNPGEVVTVAREALVDDDRWYAHAHVEQVRRPLGLDASLFSVHITSPTERHALSFYRGFGEAAFSAREVQLLDVFWRQAAVMLTAPSGRTGSGDDGQLPSRLAEVLGHLHNGRSTKEIARELGLSRHTIYDHIKRLHRRFGANSRTELIAATQHLKDELARQTAPQPGDATGCASNS